MNATRGRRGGPGPTGPAGLEPGGLGPEGLEPSKRDPIEAWLSLFVKLLGVRGEDAQRIRDELEDHLRSRVDDLMIAGADEQEAVRRAVSELGETVGETAALARRFRASTRPMTWRAIMQTAIVATLAAGLAVGLGTVVGGGGGAPTGGAPGAMSGAVGGVGAPAMAEARGGSPAGGGGAAAAGGEAASMEATAETSPIVGVPSPADDSLRSYEISAVIARNDGGGLLIQAIERLLLSPESAEAVPPGSRGFGGGRTTQTIQIVQTTLLVRGSEQTHTNVAWFLTTLKRERERAAREREMQLPILQQTLAEIDARMNELRADLAVAEARLKSSQRGFTEHDAGSAPPYLAPLVREAALASATISTQLDNFQAQRNVISDRLYVLDDPATLALIHAERRKLAERRRGGSSEGVPVGPRAAETGDAPQQ